MQNVALEQLYLQYLILNSYKYIKFINYILYLYLHYKCRLKNFF